jgi:hypothetical protein
MQMVTDTSNICVLGNFDVNPVTASFSFPGAGTWYEYLTGATFSATGAAQSITLQPGEYKVYLNRPLSGPITALAENAAAANAFQVRLFPNPVTRAGMYEIDMKLPGQVTVVLINAQGQQVRQLYSGRLSAGKHRMPLGDAVAQLPGAQYVLSVKNSAAARSVRFILH